MTSRFVPVCEHGLVVLACPHCAPVSPELPRRYAPAHPPAWSGIRMAGGTRPEPRRAERVVSRLGYIAAAVGLGYIVVRATF